MAVPFAMPEEDMNDLIRMVILILSQARSERIEENQKLLECMEELMKLLIDEMENRSRSSNFDYQLRQALNLVRQGLEIFPRRTTMRIHHRRRTISDSSCCCDDKISKIDNNQDSTTTINSIILRDFHNREEQDGAQMKKHHIKVESSVWRLFRETIKSSFWKAMPILCVVGWHLFQTTAYDCM